MHSLATDVHNGDVPLGLRPWGNSFLWVGLRSLNERKMPMYSSINQQKGVRNMRTVYRRRRIVAAIVASVLSIAVIKATYEASAFVVERITEPTFVCEPGSHTLRQGDKIWNIADVRCEGNITDAAGQIMDDNGIEGEDLDSLQPGTIIIINEKGNK